MPNQIPVIGDTILLLRGYGLDRGVRAMMESACGVMMGF
jgi:hypothetical protein